VGGSPSASMRLFPRQTRSYSTGHLTSEDVANHALERRKALNAKAQEESAKLHRRRVQQRKVLTDSMLREQQRYLEQLTSAFRGREERSAAQLQDNPLKRDSLTEFERADRSRGSSETRAAVRSDREFRATLNSTFGARTLMRDEFADACAEKRALVAREKELRTLMEAAKGQHKRANAEMRRGSFAEEVQRKRWEREEQDQMKREFMRSLTGWDGKGTKIRTKPVRLLWKEHLEKLRAAQEVSVTSYSLESSRTPADFYADSPTSNEVYWLDEDDEGMDFIEFDLAGGHAIDAAARVA